MFKINNYSYMKKKKERDSSLYRDYKLFLSEDWFEVVRIDCSIASISPFRVNISLSSKNIQFGAKTTRTESDDKVKLRKVLGPLYLLLGQYLSNRKVLKIFIICNNVDRIGQTLQVMLPNFKSLKNDKQFLIIQLYYGKSTGVKGDWMNFIFFIHNRKDCSNSTIS